MKKLILLLCLTSITAVTQEKSEFVTRFHELKEKGDSGVLEKFLLESEKSEAGNPDFYALSCNYWWGVSKKISISTKAPEKGDFVIGPTGEGKAVGSISQVGKVNPEIPEKALNLVQTGFDKFPLRLDLGFGLATMLRSMKKNEDLEKILQKILETAAKNPRNDALRWTENQSLPETAGTWVPESVHPYIKYFFDLETNDDDARCDRLTKKLTEIYPKHPYAWNMRAALASVKKDAKGVIFNLEKAHEIAPDDALILLNLADTFKKQNQPEKAREVAEKILRIESAKSRHRDATAILKSLK